MANTVAKSPYQISYDDLIDCVEARLQWMIKVYPEKVRAGLLKDWKAQHSIACERRILKLLKRHKKDPQLDLFRASESMNLKENKKSNAC